MEWIVNILAFIGALSLIGFVALLWLVAGSQTQSDESDVGYW